MKGIIKIKGTNSNLSKSVVYTCVGLSTVHQALSTVCPDLPRCPSIVDYEMTHWLEGSVAQIWQGRRGDTGKKLQTNVWKISKNNWASSIQPTCFKLGEYNLLLSNLTLRFINWVNFFFFFFLPSDSHTNTVISDYFAYPSRWRWKP